MRQLADTKVLCIQMANATISPEQRASAAETVQNMFDEIISLANTDVAGNYIFAGSKIDTVPFEQEDGTYHGDDNPFTIKIGKNSSIEIGSYGQAVFGNIFTTLSDLKIALETNDLNGIQSAMTNLDGHLDDNSAKISDVGSKMNRLEIKNNIYQDLNFSNTERLSTIEDADITEAIMNLSTAQMTYQTALASSSKVMTLTLVDYLQ